MGDNRRHAEIRVQRRKDVAEIVSSVLQDKTVELPEIEAALTGAFNRANKSEHLLREFTSEILNANMALVRMVKRMSDGMAAQHAEITGLKADVKSLMARSLTT